MAYYCKKCGAQLGETAFFCKKCGLPTEDPTCRCPACGRETSMGGTYCQLCGASLPRHTKPVSSAVQDELRRIRLRYHPIWIPIAAFLLTLLFLAGAHLFVQLKSGTFPREGVLWSAFFIAAFAYAAFYGGRAMYLHAAGFRKGEYAKAKQEYARNKKKGFTGMPAYNGVYVFLTARPLAVLLVVFVLAVLCAWLVQVPPAAQTEAAATPPSSEDVSQIYASNDGNATVSPSAKTSAELRLHGVWWNSRSGEYDDRMQAIYHFILITEDEAVFGTCADLNDIYTYEQSGTAAESMTVEKQCEYSVTQASFLPISNRQDGYLYSAVITMHERDGSLLSTWDLEYGTTLSMRNLEDASTVNLENNYTLSTVCTSTFVPAEGEGTTILPESELVLWGVWVLDTTLNDYTSYLYHAQSDIPFVFFAGDGKLYLGTCSGANNIRDFLYDSTQVFDSLIAVTGTYTCENSVVVLDDGALYPRIDSCIINVVLTPGSEPVEWTIRPGFELVTDSGATYQWGKSCEWTAP